MKVITTTCEMQSLALKTRAEGRRIGFVPTMGYLHEGHLSLIRRARDVSDWLVVSVFVNPTQFGPNEDLGRYPRDVDGDREACRREGVDVMFCPSADEMYGSGHSTVVEETVLSLGLCGASRPGHFRGVTTVIVKLFNLVQPDAAVFGQKDAQQARVVERVVHDLNIPTEVVVAPLVRERDGLAMSSRNAYLSPAERERAVCLYRSLCRAEELYAEGVRETAPILAQMRDVIADGDPPVPLEYLEAVDYRTLERVARVKNVTLVALAARVGQTRLIDNVLLGRDTPRP